MALKVVSWNIKDTSSPAFQQELYRLINSEDGIDKPDLFIGIEVQKISKESNCNNYQSLNETLKSLGYVAVEEYVTLSKTWLWVNEDSALYGNIDFIAMKPCNRVSAFIFKVNYEQFLLCCCHFPDRRNFSVAARAVYSSGVSLWVQALEDEIRSRASLTSGKQMKLAGTILAGDFNMQPFEDGMTLMNCLNAMPVNFDSTSPKSRISFQQRTSKRRFLNPCWDIYSHQVKRKGQFSSGKGSYFFRGEQENALDWYILDQVIFRPIDYDEFTIDDVILVNLYENIIDPKEWATDHLPLHFTIKPKNYADSKF